MNPTAETYPPLRLSSLDWLPIMFALYRNLQRFLKPLTHDGLYEILEYESVLELVDPSGDDALFKKRERVKFLQDYVITFQDYVWGDGEALVNYQCSPGVEVDRYREGGRWNLLISLRDTKGRGDIEDFYIQRKLKGSFIQREEWWQISMQHETRSLRLSIIFPQARRCRRAILVERNRNRTTLLDTKYIGDLPDGRQVLTWQTANPKRFETYMIKWRW